ncbi:hypothetical protein F511_27844 [Dorcoceras hygrometricum]|uniref:Uncharacterized protein n=1 Tax=Dorcoceras hygrometricum TaxID=472368 RepID=A0A2Z7BPK1_9LAMI|nr:hypothetical protein F511_27844 [Dorcoceras hygrometricum]
MVGAGPEEGSSRVAPAFGWPEVEGRRRKLRVACRGRRRRLGRLEMGLAGSVGQMGRFNRAGRVGQYAGPLGSLGLNGAGEHDADFIPTDGEDL